MSFRDAVDINKPKTFPQNMTDAKIPVDIIQPIHEPAAISPANSAIRELVCGSAGGMAGKIVEHPFDLCKVRLQTSQQFTGAIDCLRSTIKNEGFTVAFFNCFNSIGTISGFAVSVSGSNARECCVVCRLPSV